MSVLVAIKLRGSDIDQLPMLMHSIVVIVIITGSSAVADRPRDASCLSVA